MLIVVCIKQVPDTTQVQIDPVTNTLVRDGIPFIANPYDTHALEEALRMKDRFGFRVVAISMGPPNAEATLRKALSVGADADIVVIDPGRRVTVRESEMHSKADYDPHEGYVGVGWPITTISRGEIIFDDGEILSRPGRGKLLARLRRS